MNFSKAEAYYNYYEDYPISVAIQTNASQQRLQLTTFDSTLQTNIVAYTAWVNGYYLYSFQNGSHLAFTTWVNPGQQLGNYGFAIYDYVLHQFSVVEDVAVVSASEAVNATTNGGWFIVGKEIQQSPTSYQLYCSYYLYNMLTHTWNTFYDPYPMYDNQPQVWTNFGAGIFYGNLIFWIGPNDQGKFYYTNPYNGSVSYTGSGCAGWNFDIDEEHIYHDGHCNGGYHFASIDPRMGLVGVAPNSDLIGGGNNGIFYGYDDMVHHPLYIFTYDLGSQTTLVHTEFNPTASNLVIKDRVISWTVASNGSSPWIYFMVHDPIQHAFVLDSVATSNVVTPSIINGTVHWADSTGSHIRGYDVSTGWGNFNTPLFMYFHLTDFAATDSIPLVHVRNYSIGEEDFYFDMGDGSITNFADNAWRIYDQSGNYDVCMYNSTGTQSVCETVSIISCSVAGNISASVDTICEGDTLVLSVSGNVGNVQWQYSLNEIDWLNISSPGFDSTTIHLPVSATAYYRAHISSSNCFAVNSIPLKVYMKPKLTSGVILTVPTSGCEGATIRLQLIGYSSGLQWQQNNGSGWVNVVNGNFFECNVVLNGNTDFRVISNNYQFGCPGDTTQVVSIQAQAPGTINPVTNFSCCGNDTITLSVSGSGTMLWYEAGSPGSLLVNTGPSLTDYFTASTTYSVGALSGNPETIGVADTTTGSPATLQPFQQGFRIKTNQPGYLSSVTIYPQSTGNLNVLLYPLNGNLITAFSYNVTAANVPLVLPLDFYLSANLEYDILFYCAFNVVSNCGGFTYPMISSGGSYEIKGSINQNIFSTDSCNNFIYDIRLLQGCRSALIPVTVNYFPVFTGSLTAQGPTSFCQGGSVTLQAAPNGGYSYSWYRNGVVIPNATTNNLLVTQAGNYASRVYNSGCADTTASIRVTIPCITPLDPQEKNNFGTISDDEPVFMLQQSDASLILIYNVAFNSKSTIQVCDLSGRTLTSVEVQDLKGINKREIDISDFSHGCYIIRWLSQDDMRVKKWIR